MKKSILAGAAISGCLLFSSPGGMAAPFGNEDDIMFAKALWQALEKSSLVGPGRINVRPFEGNEPHGAIQQVLGTKVMTGGRMAKVLVKVNHMGKAASIATVYDNPNKFIGAYTVMLKREAGYDPDNKDWFWAKYRADGTLDKNPKGIALAGRVAKGADKGCIFCHTAIGGEDLETLTEK